MQIYHSLRDLPKFENTVITIGSYDGVHTGHKKILQQVTSLAEEVKGESVVITFHPHPRFVLKGKQDNLKLLTSIEEKSDLLEKSGIKHLVVVPFSAEFSQQSPEDYLKEFLIKYFKPKYIVIGYDHRFGKDRAGNIDFLKKYEKEYDFKVVEIAKQTLQDIDISSTKIRKALENKEIQTANSLLGHHFILHGRVVEGDKIGRKIGFPTANIEVVEEDKLIPPYGIYAVWVFWGTKRYGGMLYIGERPTVDKTNRRVIEVNLFNFEENIYDEFLWIEFVDFIRNDKKFDGLEELQMALGRDRIRAQYLLNPPR